MKKRKVKRIKTRHFWKINPKTQVVPNKKKQPEKYKTDYTKEV